MKKTMKNTKGRGVPITQNERGEGKEEKHTFFVFFFFSKKLRSAWVALQEALV